MMLIEQCSNILVVVLDSVRAKNTSLHGYSHQTTPFLERLGRENIFYRHAYAPSTTSISSHISLFTGLHEDEHRVYGTDPSIAEHASLWSQLRDIHGFETGLFTQNPQFNKPVGLRYGFDHEVLRPVPFPNAADPSDFETPDQFPFPDIFYTVPRLLLTRQPTRAFRNGLAFVRGKNSSEHLLRSFFDWSASVDGPWAAFMNLMDAHTPFTPVTEHNKWTDDKLLTVQQEAGGGHFYQTKNSLSKGIWWHPSTLEHLYDGAIHQADEVVRQIVERLRGRGIFDDTLMIITSDHGEAFGERSRLHTNHHLFAHAVGVHEVQAHVPLVVSPPGDSSSQRIDSPATLTQLFDAVKGTITDEFDPDAFLGRDGRVLVSRGHGGSVRYRLNDAFSAGKQDPLPDRVYAGYERTDGQLMKYCRSGDDMATVRICDAQNSIKIASDEPGVLS